ncbi:hypothetical protein [Methanolobus sp. ZRKC5]|uniref:ComEC/Rec2 family competence protein n=1 Tax=unclassified Methanolobus TaxID=2629569 RepID=UPI00313DF6E9
MLRVFNVGQGDSFELIPSEHCLLSETSLLIDCGQGSKNVFKALHNKKINLVLSHSHTDHIGGLSGLFDDSSSDVEINELWLPCYSDEIVAIANFLLSLKGVSKISSRSRAVLELQNTVQAYQLLQGILSTKGCKKIRPLGKGVKICSHLSILNPPFDPDLVLHLEIGTSEKYREIQQTNDYEKIRSWVTSEDFNNKWIYLLAEGWNRSGPNLINNNSLSLQQRMDFIYGFISKNESLIDDFVLSGDSRYFTKLANELKLTSNDASIVLKYKSSISHDDFSCLLTGDIGKKRLSDSLSGLKDEKIKIFKFPHHGSKNSLDKDVLKRLSPEIVIISHKNGIFGRQKDPHPNKKVVETLDKMNILTAYTNDVIKNGNIIKNKSKRKPHEHVEMVDIW